MLSASSPAPPIIARSIVRLTHLHGHTAVQTTRILDSLLQLPGVCVLWSLREQAWGSLPADPAEFSRAKGGAALKIVPFAPQRHVLAHPNGNAAEPLPHARRPPSPRISRRHQD